VEDVGEKSRARDLFIISRSLIRSGDAARIHSRDESLAAIHAISRFSDLRHRKVRRR
jgi:hypothetical protein